MRPAKPKAEREPKEADADGEEIAMPPLPTTLPTFTSERLKLLAPLITPRVWQLALYRFCGGRLMKGKDIVVPDGKVVVKTALVLAHEMWPHLSFKMVEEGLMRGMDMDTVGIRRRQGLLKPL